jgi:YesN/AraC family two-component response regulator
MKPVRIVLANDHPLIREAIGHLGDSTPEFELVGGAANGKECLVRVQELRPDILVLDIAMPEMNREQVAREIRRRYPEVKVIALSGYTDRQFVN